MRVVREEPPWPEEEYPGSKPAKEKEEPAPEEVEAEAPWPTSGSDFFQREPAPPEWLVDGLILKGSLTCFAGPAGSGKTALGLESVIRIAKAGKYRTLIIEEEGTEYELKHRLIEGGADELDFESIDFSHGWGVDLASEEWRLKFEGKLPGYELVMLDSLADVVGTDLLDYRALNEQLKWLRQTFRRYRKTCLMLAHTPKAFLSSDAPPSISDIFGSQTIGAKLDGAFILRDFKPPREVVDGAEDGEVYEEERREAARNKEVWCVKLRGIGQVPPRVGQIEKVYVGGGPGSVGLWRWQGGTPMEVKREHRIAKAKPVILEALKAFGPQTSRNELYKRMANGGEGSRPKRNVYLAAMASLIRSREVQCTDTGSVSLLCGGSLVPGGSRVVPEPVEIPLTLVVPGSHPPKGGTRETSQSVPVLTLEAKETGSLSLPVKDGDVSEEFEPGDDAVFPKPVEVSLGPIGQGEWRKGGK